MQSPVTNEGNSSIQIFYSGNIKGYLESCGCGGRREGGLVKWGAFIKKETQELSLTLILDSGNFTSTQMNVKELKSEYTAKALAEIEYDAMNLSEEDISQLGKNTLINLGEKYNLPFISSNIFHLKSMKLLTTPYIIKSFSSPEIKIGILGLAKQINLEKEGLIIKNPINTAKELVEELRNKCDLIVVLTQLNKENSILLAKEIGEIDIIICGKSNYPGNELDKVNKTIILQPVAKMEKAGAIKLYFNDTGKITSYEERNTLLDDNISADEKIVKINEEYKKKIRQKELSEPDLKFTRIIYAGTKKCGECHQKQYKKWQKTKHAKAFYSLKKAKEDKNPECLKCHTTGFKQDNGFLDYETTPDFINVGCEECHRLGVGHVAIAKTPSIDKEFIKISSKPGKVDSDSICTKCHTNEKDPEFNFEEDKKKIAH